MKILAIDDLRMIVKVIKTAVDSLGYEFLSANDGIEGMAIIKKEYNDIGLIMLDWNMPWMDGFEVLKAVKADAQFKHIPVVMITTVSEKENITKAIATGASHYLLKPFNEEDLIKTIKKFVLK